MPRVRPGSATRKRHKRTLRKAKGFWGSRSKLFRIAKQFVTKAGVYAYRDRKARKREFRSLWIIRATAASLITPMDARSTRSRAWGDNPRPASSGSASAGAAGADAPAT